MPNTNTKQEKPSILRRKQVEWLTGLSRSTMYHLIEEGAFPKPVNLGQRAVGWLESEVDVWLASRMTGAQRIPDNMSLRYYKDYGMVRGSQA